MWQGRRPQAQPVETAIARPRLILPRLLVRLGVVPPAPGEAVRVGVNAYSLLFTLPTYDRSVHLRAVNHTRAEKELAFPV